MDAPTHYNGNMLKEHHGIIWLKYYINLKGEENERRRKRSRKNIRRWR